jgi:hypothetical protein
MEREREREREVYYTRFILGKIVAKKAGER